MRLLLRPFSWIYGVIVSLRFTLYKYGVLKKIRLSKPVVSVGNLTFGGTGKTPFVSALLDQMELNSHRVAVLTRGYGRKSKKSLMANSKMMSDETGDEPKWLKSKHSQAQILVSRNRAVDAQEIKDADIFILDDGRQHIRLHRNFEITLLDTTRDFCSYKMFPEGMAREPWKNLKCSDLIILTRSNLVDLQKIRQLKAEISRTGFDGPIIQSSLHVKELKKLRAGQNNVACEVFLISGIGNPKSFETLVRLTYPQFIIKGIKEFPDHVGYTTQGLLSAMSDALKAGASSIVITEKDAVKWIEIMSDIDGTKIDGPKIDIFVLETFLVFEPNLPDIYDLAINKNH